MPKGWETRPLVISRTIEITVPSVDNRNIEAVEANFRQCVLNEYNIKINYPSDWNKKTDNPNSQVKVIFEAPKEVSEQIPDYVEVCVDDKIGEMTLDACIKKLIENLREQCSDFELIESTPTTLSGIGANQIIFSSSQKMLKSLVVVTTKDKVAYLVSYIADPSSYLKFLSSVKQMISSFEIVSHN
jgi:serine/threonine-protein kinase